MIAHLFVYIQSCLVHIFCDTKRILKMIVIYLFNFGIELNDNLIFDSVSVSSRDIIQQEQICRIFEN